METNLTISLLFRVYTEEPGSHIVICQNHPEIVFSCTSLNDGIEKAKEKMEFYIKKDKSFFNSGDVLSAHSKAEAGQFQLVYDINECKCLRVDLARHV